MLIAIFGLRTPRTQSAVRLTRLLLDATIGQHHVVEGNSAEQFLEACSQRDNAHLFAYSDIPDARVVDAFQASRTPVALFLDDAVDTVEFLMRAHKADLLSAIRTASLFFAALHDLAISGAAAIVGPERANPSQAAAVCRLAEIYQLRLSQSQLDTVMRRLASEGDSAEAVPDTAITTPQERELIRQVLGPYESLLRRRKVREAYWPREMFRANGLGDLLTPGSIDLTGAARIIFYGPYLHLPAGRWLATPLFEVSDNETGNVLSIDVSSGRILVKGQCALPPSGAYVCDLAFEIDDPRSAIEVRFWIEKGAIGGRLDIKGVQVRRV